MKVNLKFEKSLRGDIEKALKAEQQKLAAANARAQKSWRMRLVRKVNPAAASFVLGIKYRFTSPKDCVIDIDMGAVEGLLNRKAVIMIFRNEFDRDFGKGKVLIS